MDSRLPHHDLQMDENPGAEALIAPTPLELIERVMSNPLGGFEVVAPTTRAGVATTAEHASILALATDLMDAPGQVRTLDAAGFFQRHGADSAQGIALMLLAESFVRAPDDAARQALLFDILPRANWTKTDHVGALEGLARLTERFDQWAPNHALSSAIKTLGSRTAAKAAMAAISGFAQSFVAGQDTSDVARLGARLPLHSFDMLGEAATTEDEARAYFERYMGAVEALPPTSDLPWTGHGISVKLSALDPLFDRRHDGRSFARDRLIEISKACQAKNLMLTVDAEEAERLVLSCSLLEQTISATRDDWEGFGWAIQANLRASGAAIEHALGIARSRKRRLALRLVKGAYWDTETRRALSGGYPNPAWPAKVYTDRAWITGALALLREPYAYPMLASHNPHSCAAASILASGIGGPFEFQRLHGMGASLHAKLERMGRSCRIYSPIGATAELLPYLVRRMLENGANTSILRLGADSNFDPAVAFANPFASRPGALAPSWESLYEPARANSPGFPLWMREHDISAKAALVLLDLRAQSSVSSEFSAWIDVLGPSGARAGVKREASESDLLTMLDRASLRHARAPRPTSERSQGLERAARSLDLHRATILGAIVAETGKRMEDALSEWREARDFCLFHARQAKELRAQRLPSLPGEENWIWPAPRGVALCVSPWNFPFAILMGQASAALAAGCPVLVKGASSASLCAQLVVDALRSAGFGPDDIQHVVAPSSMMEVLLRDPRVAVVAFTGSAQVARSISSILAQREGAPARLIAETGGFNLMLVDESAHLDSSCSDILESAFNMSGQRCSSLRAAWIDERVFTPLMNKLSGALRARSLGNPSRQLHVDFGPLIDSESARQAETALARLLAIPGNELVARAERPAGLGAAYFAPAIVSTSQSSMVREEMFFPILQTTRFAPGDEERMALPWAQGGYGLTFGIQTRKPATAEKWALLAPAGNIYVNRSMTGATVGSQPFGGEGLSGTGPKIGGASYVPAFCFERVLSNNNAAFGACLDLFGGSHSTLHRFFPE